MPDTNDFIVYNFVGKTAVSPTILKSVGVIFSPYLRLDPISAAGADDGWISADFFNRKFERIGLEAVGNIFPRNRIRFARPTDAVAELHRQKSASSGAA